MPTAPRRARMCSARCWSAIAPCVVLMDELVAYIRQFVESQPLSGGTYDSNLSFVQALTEAAKLVPNAVVLASLAGIGQPGWWAAWRGGAAGAGGGL